MKTIAPLLLAIAVSLVLGSCGMSRGNFNKQKFTKLRKIDSKTELVVEESQPVLESVETEETVEEDVETGEVTYLETFYLESTIDEEEVNEDLSSPQGSIETIEVIEYTNEESDNSEEVINSPTDYEPTGEELAELDEVLRIAQNAFIVGMVGSVCQAAFFIIWAFDDILDVTAWTAGDAASGLIGAAGFVTCIALSFKYNRLCKDLGVKKSKRFYLWIPAMLLTLFLFPNVIYCFAIAISGGF